MEHFVLTGGDGDVSKYATYFKIYVRGMLSPIKIKLDYEKNDLFCYVSNKVSRPNDGQYDNQYINPGLINIYAHDVDGSRQKTFDEDWVYVSFCSD